MASSEPSARPDDSDPGDGKPDTPTDASPLWQVALRDVAVETSRVSACTDLSWRRGYWVVPKFLFGVPTDQLHQGSARRLGFVPLRWRMKACTCTRRTPP